MTDYALQQNATGAHCRIKTLDGSANTTIFIDTTDTFEIEFSLKHNNTDHGRPFGYSVTSTANRGFVYATALTARLSNNTATNTDFTLSSYTRSDYNTFKFVRDVSNNLTCYLNGVAQDTTKTFTGSITIDQLFQNGASTTSNNGLEFFKVTINGVLAYHFYDTTGTGLVLAEHVNGTVRANLVGFVDDDTQWSAIAGGSTTVSATLAAIDVTTYPATVTAAQIISATVGVVSVGAYTATVTTSQPTTVNATLATIGVTAYPATVTTAATITTEPLKNNTGTLLSSTGSIIASVYSLSTGALIVRKTGLTSDGAGVVAFSDAALVASTEYLVTITIATADGVARLTAE